VSHYALLFGDIHVLQGELFLSSLGGYQMLSPLLK